MIKTNSETVYDALCDLMQRRGVKDVPEFISYYPEFFAFLLVCFVRDVERLETQTGEPQTVESVRKAVKPAR